MSFLRKYCREISCFTTSSPRDTNSVPALTDFFLKRDAKEKVFISRTMNAGVRESEKTEIYDDIEWTKLIKEMGYKIRTYPILT